MRVWCRSEEFESDNVSRVSKFQICGNILRMGFLRACDEMCGKMGIRDAKEIYSGGMKRSLRQYQEIKIHTRVCVGIVLRRM